VIDGFAALVADRAGVTVCAAMHAAKNRTALHAIDAMFKSQSISKLGE
jgi:hypothetical protein